MSDSDCRDPACQRAADLAVKRTFAIMGVDVDDPASVAKFNEDLRFNSRMRRAADHGFLVMIGLGAVALGTALWAGFQSLIKG